MFSSSITNKLHLKNGCFSLCGFPLCFFDLGQGLEQGHAESGFRWFWDFSVGPRNNHSVHRVCIAIAPISQEKLGFGTYIAVIHQEKLGFGTYSALASSEKLGFGTYSALLSPEKLGFGTHSALFSQEKTRVWDSQCIIFPGETRVCALVSQEKLLFRVH